MSDDWIKRVSELYLEKRSAGRREIQGSPAAATGEHDRERPTLLASQFSAQLRHLQETVLQYEDQALLDQALDTLPLERLFAEAEAAETSDPSWGVQEHLIKGLLKWFRNEFFTWVNEPPCTKCQGKTEAKGVEAPTPSELADGAGRTEVYECPADSTVVRFPRYNRPQKLLTWRKGRCGEWANCFPLLCRALGSRVRWVWCAEDHVWTEIYSDRQRRWVHADACETAWDQPRLYEQGWGKKMSYVIAFAVEGATDVSRRYVREEGTSLPRARISEGALQLVLEEITRSRRQHLSPEERQQLAADDAAEQVELESFVKSTPTASTSSDELRPRETGAGGWTESRGENGRH